MAKKRPEKQSMPATDTEQATRVVSIKLTAEEHRRLRVAASENDQTMKAYLTGLALAAIGMRRRPKGDV